MACSWPESYNACTIRSDLYAGEVIEKIRNADVKTAHLIVSHGILTQNFAYNVYGQTPDSRDKDLIDVKTCIDHTGISSAVI